MTTARLTATGLLLAALPLGAARIGSGQALKSPERFTAFAVNTGGAGAVQSGTVEMVVTRRDPSTIPSR